MIAGLRNDEIDARLFQLATDPEPRISGPNSEPAAQSSLWKLPRKALTQRHIAIFEFVRREPQPQQMTLQIGIVEVFVFAAAMKNRGVLQELEPLLSAADRNARLGKLLSRQRRIGGCLYETISRSRQSR
jgi:hypothetical protein